MKLGDCVVDGGAKGSTWQHRKLATERPVELTFAPDSVSAEKGIRVEFATRLSPEFGAETPTVPENDSRAVRRFKLMNYYYLC